MTLTHCICWSWALVPLTRFISWPLLLIFCLDPPQETSRLTSIHCVRESPKLTAKPSGAVTCRLMYLPSKCVRPHTSLPHAGVTPQPDPSCWSLWCRLSLIPPAWSFNYPWLLNLHSADWTSDPTRCLYVLKYLLSSTYWEVWGKVTWLRRMLNFSSLSLPPIVINYQLNATFLAQFIGTHR